MDGIAGGDYWQALAANPAIDFMFKVQELIKSYTRLLEQSFQSRGRPKGWVGYYGVKSRYHHKVPKYYLVYATRHRDGIDLMNDATCKARREFVRDEFPAADMLFDPTPVGELVDQTGLQDELMALASQMNHSFTRKELRLHAISHNFGRYSSKDFNNAIADLLKQRRMFSATGVARINDKVLLQATPFARDECNF